MRLNKIKMHLTLLSFLKEVRKRNRAEQNAKKVEKYHFCFWNLLAHHSQNSTLCHMYIFGFLKDTELPQTSRAYCTIRRRLYVTFCCSSFLLLHCWNVTVAIPCCTTVIMLLALCLWWHSVLLYYIKRLEHCCVFMLWNLFLPCPLAGSPLLWCSGTLWFTN